MKNFTVVHNKLEYLTKNKMTTNISNIHIINLDKWTQIVNQLPYYKLFIDNGLILAGGSLCTLFYNEYKQMNSSFSDIDFFYCSNLYDITLLEKLKKIYKFFRTKGLNFICTYYNKNDYWVSQLNEYTKPIYIYF